MEAINFLAGALRPVETSYRQMFALVSARVYARRRPARESVGELSALLTHRQRLRFAAGGSNFPQTSTAQAI